eukprot:gene41506-50650_t
MGRKIHISDPWYDFVKSGLKTIEGRLHRGEFAIIQPGDSLEFFNEQGSFVKVVIACDIYDSFQSYLTAKGLANTLPGVTSLEEGIKVYYKYYTPQEEQEF